MIRARVTRIKDVWPGCRCTRNGFRQLKISAAHAPSSTDVLIFIARAIVVTPAGLRTRDGSIQLVQHNDKTYIMLWGMVDPDRGIAMSGVQPHELYHRTLMWVEAELANPHEFAVMAAEAI